MILTLKKSLKLNKSTTKRILTIKIQRIEGENEREI